MAEAVSSGADLAPKRARTWYRSLYAPRTGGAHDSHHRDGGNCWLRSAARLLRGPLAARAQQPDRMRRIGVLVGMMSYGENLSDFFRRAASFVDKIIKGAKPGDLPIEQPTKFNLVINRTTADAISVTIPSHLYIFADEVIE